MVNIVIWLMLGHAALAGLFWALLQVPESNAWMVAVSALLAIAIVAGIAWVESVALLSWAGTDTRRARLRRGMQAVPALLVATLPFVVLYYLTSLADTWLQAHSGEIDAWLIVHLKVVKGAGVHATIGWLLWLVRYVLGTSFALALFARLTAAEMQSASQFGWLRAALGWRRLAVIGLALLVLAWLPWQGVFWRPNGMRPTWVEPAFIAVKLAVIYLLANVGWALVLRVGATVRRP